MIRRKVSTGLLRASKSSSSLRSTAMAQAASAAPSPVSQQQTAGLASATLLNSQRNWGKETVVTLRGELKKRGLSQIGNKGMLVDRLKSAEMSALLPPMPSLPPARKLSTTPKLSKKKGSAAPAAPAVQAVQAVQADEIVNSTGPVIETQKAQAPKAEPIAPEQVSVAPGLPETKSKGHSAPLDIKIPSAPKEKPAPQVIPVEPDNFRTKTQVADPAPVSSTPKVVTVASAATHHEGGPTHAVHDAVDATQIEITDGTPDVPSLTRAWDSLKLSTAIPGIGAPRGEFKGEEYKASTRSLDGNERKGLWALAGIVGFGFLAGGLGNKKEKTGHSGKDTKGAKAVAGDAKWEQPSGAHIVGHGARKD